MAEFDSFREEFNELMDKAGVCDTGNCEEEKDDNEDFPDYIIELKTKMLRPEKCGIYFSKHDIRNIAKSCGESISLKQRDRMMNDLLMSIFDLDEMTKAFDAIKVYIDQRVGYYDELGDAFSESKPFFAEYKPKALALRRSLDRILIESNGQVMK
jgi:hypothetical protein